MEIDKSDKKGPEIRKIGSKIKKYPSKVSKLDVVNLFLYINFVF